jgi:hypothetical protein
MISRRLTVLIGALALVVAAVPAAAHPATPSGVASSDRSGADASSETAAAGVPTEQAGGGIILFDQLTTRPQVAVGLPVQRFDPPNARDAEGADDFQVLDPGGWTIGEVAFGLPGFGMNGRRGAVDVRVYPNAAGSPGEAAICSYDDITAEQHGTEQLRVPLPTPCVLERGRYWLSLQKTAGQLRWALGTPAPHSPPFVLGARAHWRNPGDGWGTRCTGWSDISNCLADGEPITNGFDTQALFQVCGAVGQNVENFAGCGNEEAAHELTVTLAPDNGDPARCGTSTTLTVQAGDRVNVCYTILNTGTATLDFHWLRDNLSFRPLTAERFVASGRTLQFNRLITAVRSRTISAVAQATDELPWYFTEVDDREFVDISGSGTPLNLDDDGSANVALPFGFDLFGTTSDEVCINNNGFLLVGWDRPCDGFHHDLSVPNESVPIETGQVAPFWDDLFTGGNVYHAVVGTAPNRRFVVQWDEKNHYDNGSSDPGTVTFEAILDEATDAISFQYRDTTFDNPQHPEWDRGGDATVGFQSLVRDGFGGSWRQYSFRAPVLEPDSGLTWHSTGYFQATAEGAATLNVAAPSLAVAPDAVTASAEQGSRASVPLTIANEGERDLQWQVGEAPAASSQRQSAPSSPARDGLGSGPDTAVDPFGRPRWQKPVRVPSVSESQALADFKTPAFASRFEFFEPPFGPRYQRINDIANPADTTELSSLIGRDVFAGDFIGDDFSRQFLIDECCRQLLTIDTETGETTINRGIIQGSPEVVVWRGLAWDATTETLFAVGTDTFAALPDTRFFLARLQLGHDVVATTIGELPGLERSVSIIDIAVDPAGRVFGVDIQRNLLWAIDKETADASAIGDLGFNATGALGLDFDDATGKLYLASLDADSQIGSLYTVDTLTGGASAVGQLGDGSQHMALAIASGGPCVPPGEVPWLSLSPTEGTTAPGGSDQVTVTLDATGLAVGTHKASVCVASNDPGRPVAALPIAFTVLEADGTIALRAEKRRVKGVNTVDAPAPPP